MILVVAEKPSVAKDIASFLKASLKCEGYFEGNGYRVTWAYGHLITIKEPEEYDSQLKKWSLATLPFIPQQFELKVVEDAGTRKQFSIIKKLLKEAREIICATDAGREGELIFRYIIKMAQCEQKMWKRLWLSSLTEEALSTAFKNLQPGTCYDNLYAAAKCRHEADWIVGLNATRNYTVRYGFGKNLWTIGRVQTPVLAMIVKRDEQIRCFKSEPFWEISTRYKEVIFKHKHERFSTLAAAETILSNIKDNPLTILKILRKKENELPPLLYDLTELQREMNRKFGMTAAGVLQIAQTLYEQKLITYPRTDSRYLTVDMKESMVSLLQSLKGWKTIEIERIDLTKLNLSNRYFNNKKVTDHHAILPTGKISKTLSGNFLLVYDAIVNRFISIFYPACIKEVVTIDAICQKEEFAAKTTLMIDPGWTVLYPVKTEESKENSINFSFFKEGESGTHFPIIKEGKTTPPLAYTESSLLGAMETAGKGVQDESLREALKEKGLGTPATRASIIEILLKRGYIQRLGKSLVALDLGRYLIALIQNDHLKSPELTGEWEAKLKQIEQGEFSASKFMDHIVEFTQKVVKESDITHINAEKYGNCPKCQSEIIKGKKGFGCSKWREGCRFVLWANYQGIQLSEQQVKILLQKGILLQPIAGNILHLNAEGEVVEIPVPVENHSFRKKRTSKTYRKPHPKPRRPHENSS